MRKMLRKFAQLIATVAMRVRTSVYGPVTVEDIKPDMTVTTENCVRARLFEEMNALAPEWKRDQYKFTPGIERELAMADETLDEYVARVKAGMVAVKNNMARNELG